MATQPLYIGTNTAFAEALTKNWNAAKQRVQKTLYLYAATGLPALTTAEFPRLLSAPKELLFDKIVGEGGSTALFNAGEGDHVEVDKLAAFSIMRKPAGTRALLADIEQLAADTEKGWEMHNHGIKTRFPFASITAYFMLDNSGALQFTDAHAAALADYGKLYLNTEKGQAHYQFVQAMQEAFFAAGLDKYYPAVYGQVPGHGIELIEMLVRKFFTGPDFANKAFTVSPVEYAKLDNPALVAAFF